MIAGVGLEPNHVWAPCCETWLKFEIEALHCRKKLKLKKMFGSWMSPLVGRHVVKHGLKKMEGKFAIAERKKM